MAASTSSQTSLLEHANPAPPQADNTEALSTQMTQFGEQINAQLAQMMAMFNTMNTRMEALELRYGIIPATRQTTAPQTTQTTQQSTQQSTPPAPQEAKKEEANHEENTEITAEKQEQKPLYQATVEDDTEHGNSMLDSKTTLSTIPRLCTIPTSGDSAACLSNALFFATQYALILMLNTVFGYIEHSEGMEATGEG